MQKRENQNPNSDAIKLWPVLCAALTAAGSSYFCTNLWGRRQSALSLTLTVFSAAVGLVLGIVLKKTKKGRIASLSVSTALFALFIAGGIFFTSDFYLCKKDWPVYTTGKASFSYPSLQWKKTQENVALANGSVSMYTNENLNRYVCAFVYDFTDDYPELSECLSSAVNSMMQGFKIKGTDSVTWDQVPEYTQNSVCTRFYFKKDKKIHAGFAFAVMDGPHYELVMFFPLKKTYSTSFLKKLEEGVSFSE